MTNFHRERQHALTRDQRRKYRWYFEAAFHGFGVNDLWTRLKARIKSSRIHYGIFCGNDTHKKRPDYAVNEYLNLLTREYWNLCPQIICTLALTLSGASFLYSTSWTTLNAISDDVARHINMHDIVSNEHPSLNSIGIVNIKDASVNGWSVQDVLLWFQ